MTTGTLLGQAAHSNLRYMFAGAASWLGTITSICAKINSVLQLVALIGTIGVTALIAVKLYYEVREKRDAFDAKRKRE